jgi:hypothetical protein
MQGGIGSVIFGWLLWRWTGNLVLSAIISCVLWPLFQPLFGWVLSLLGKLIRWIRSLSEPDSEFITLSASGAGQKKMRVLVIAQNSPISSQREYENVYASKVQSVIDEFRAAGDKRFDFKYRYVIDNNLAADVAGGWYKNIMHKCIKQYLAKLRADGFLIGDMDKDVFEKFKDVNGGKANIAIIFEKSVPEPPKDGEPQTAANETVTLNSATSASGAPVKVDTVSQ